jgi:magnesium chelatase family protein
MIYKSKVTCNARMTSRQLRKHCVLDQQSIELLKEAVINVNLSARAYDRILKVARTIADLAASPRIQPDHLAEAVQYRALDRSLW